MTRGPGAVSWILDALAEAYQRGELEALRHTGNPAEAARAMALHLQGAVEAILIDERARPRSEAARTVVESVRAKVEARNAWLASSRALR